MILFARLLLILLLVVAPIEANATLPTQSSTVTLQGNASTYNFTFPFVAGEASYINVIYTNTSGVQTLLSPSTYSLTINPAAVGQIWGIGGMVTYPLVGSPIPSGSSITIQRVLPLLQTTSLVNQGNFYPETVESTFDTQEMQTQQLNSRTTQWRGIWATNTIYNYGDIVQDGTAGLDTLNYYICETPNISGTWKTDLANGDWAISAIAAVPTGNLALLGDITGSGTSPITTTLATVNSNVGTFANATITVNAKGLITGASSGGSSGGTVTSVTFTGDGILDSATPSAAVTSSGTLTATPLTKQANKVLAGPASGSNAAPTFRSLVAADLPSSANPNVYQATPSNPTLTTSTTPVMMGLAGTFTPNNSGDVEITINGDITNFGNQVSRVQISYGTGTAPGNGAAQTGTQVGSKLTFNTSGQGGNFFPFSSTAIITGLTPNTPIWLDLAVTSAGGSNTTVQDISISAFEVK